MMSFKPLGPLRGTARIPGDKSISHRALILASLAVGQSRIEGLSDGMDAQATIAALQQMGPHFEQAADGAWLVDGVGVGGLLQPTGAFDLGNSGTSARLLMGLVASHPIQAAFAGDSSLSRRPMERVAAPLRRIGARIDGHCLPLRVQGSSPAIPVAHRLDIASAQVHSALLLAGLNTSGTTEIVERVRTRDHLVRLLRLFGATVESDGLRTLLRGEAELEPQRLSVAGDASAAAFLAVAALIVPGSEIRIAGVGANPARSGLYEVLAEMGADLSLENPREISGEPIVDLVVRHGPLTAVDVPPEIAPRMIDEYPILAVAAAFAAGTTRMRGLAELRLKESDRIAAMAPIGAVAEGDDLLVEGSAGEPIAGGFTVDPRLDHRVAMAFAVAGLHARLPVGIADMSVSASSFPGFCAALDGLADA